MLKCIVVIHTFFFQGPQKSETSSSGVIIGAVTGSLISLFIIMLVLSFAIVKKRRGKISDN